MSNDLTTFTFTFTFNTSPIRVVTIDGNPWFVAKDALTVLDLSLNNQSTHLARLAQNERGITQANTPRGLQQMAVISESGLYKLIMRSDKPQAKGFQDWVTKEVLPSIRKNGGYILGQEKLVTGEMTKEQFFAKALVAAQAIMSDMDEIIAHQRLTGADCRPSRLQA